MLFYDLPAIGRVAQEVTPTVGSEVLPTTTPIVINPADIPQGQIANPLDGNFLGAAAQADLGPFSGILLILGIIALVAGAYFFFVGKNRWRNTHRLNFRLTNTWGVIAMALGAAAVAFVLFRLFNIEGLNTRFWLYLIGLVWAIFLGYGLYYYFVRYKVDLAAYNRSQRPVRAPRVTTGPNALPERPKGTAGNPRGTSERGDRRREKRS